MFTWINTIKSETERSEHREFFNVQSIRRLEPVGNLTRLTLHGGEQVLSPENIEALATKINKACAR